MLAFSRSHSQTSLRHKRSQTRSPVAQPASEARSRCRRMAVLKVGVVPLRSCRLLREQVEFVRGPNRVLKMGGGGRLLLRVGGRAGCRRGLLTVLAADRRCRLAAGGCGSGGLGVEGGDAEEVVDGGGDLEPGSVAFSASVAELSSAGDSLDPCERFLDPLADR